MIFKSKEKNNVNTSVIGSSGNIMIFFYKRKQHSEPLSAIMGGKQRKVIRRDGLWGEYYDLFRGAEALPITVRI